jgi:hypothetical protein
MLIWDPDVITSSDDLFESREQPTEVLVAQMRSKGQPDSKNVDVARALQGKLTPIARKYLSLPTKSL